MSEQNFKNHHKRLIPLYHYVAGLLVICRVRSAALLTLLHRQMRIHIIQQPCWL